MTSPAVVTAIAKNYLAFARTLAGSLRRHHPDLPLYVLLADEAGGYFDPAREPFTMLRLEDLSIPDLPRLQRRYSRKQLAAAAKPYLLDHVLTRAPAGTIFLDPDVLALGDLGALLSHVAAHAVTLTPHLLAPLTGSDAAARELNILQSGTFNAGFVGVTDSPSARRFLSWWKQRVERHCRHDVAEGLYYDQRWLDLAPVFFEDVSILRDPACNVGHWNLPERRVIVDGERVTVDGRPGVFFHFSGFDPEQPAVVTRYSARLDMESVGPSAELFSRYAELLMVAGYRETIGWPYAYDGAVRSAAERGWRAAASLRRRS